MAGAYTVKILGSDDFDKLPFKRIMENPGPVMGAADRRTKTAYVRDTGFNDFTKATIEHELDELMAQTSPHEEDGIRYKDFSQSFGNFLGNIPVIGSVAKPLGQLAGGGIDLLGAGARKVGLPSFNMGAPSPAAPMAMAGSNIGGAMVNNIPRIKSATTFPGFGSGFGASTINRPLTNLFQKPTAPTDGTSAAPSFMQRIFSGAKKGLAPSSGGGTQVGGFDFGETVGRALPGVATSFMGNLFAPKVTAPDLSGIRSDLASRIGEGGSPAYDLGFGEASRILNAPTQDVPDEVFAASERSIDEGLADNLTNLRNTFKALNPTANVENNSAFVEQKQRLERDAELAKANLRAQVSFDYVNQQMARRVQTMQTVLNLDQAQFDQYAQLAQLDVYELMMKTGIDAQTATEFKQLFGNIGQVLLQNAFPGGQGGSGGITINV